VDIRQYRQQIEKELEDPTDDARAGVVGESLEASTARVTSEIKHTMQDKQSDPQVRARWLVELPLSESNAAEAIPLLLTTLRDPTEASVVRLAALRGLQGASFLPPLFSPWRAEFLQTLRELATDQDEALRERAMELLATHKDDYVQRLLMDGLRNPERALVAAAKAVQFLGYDIHADYFPMLRDLAQRAADTSTRVESLRVLATDPESRDMFARLYQDIKENREVRALSAAGLQFLDPARFVEVGKRIVADANEYDDIRATTMNALSRFDEYRDVLHDSGFVERLKSIGENAQPGRLLDSVRRFLRRRDEDE
jgi:hypothetical protein